MPSAVEILIAGSVVAVLRQFDTAQRAQFDRLVAALRLAPQAGVFYAHDGDGRVLWQVSGADLHVIYTITYRAQRERVFIVAIDVAEWLPQHTMMP